MTALPDAVASEEFSIAASAAEVRRASDWLESVCRKHCVPQEKADRLVLSLNEVLENAIVYGGTAVKSSPVGLRFEGGPELEGGKAGVTVSDSGAAFNPLTVAEKKQARNLEEATPGGLGLVMLHRLSDWLDYRHADGRNHLSFGVRWAEIPHASTHFRRGPDRRTANRAVGQERRRAARRDHGIRWIALFRDADPAELERALVECEVLLLPAGQALLRPGMQNQNVFILLSGKLNAYIGGVENPDAAIEILPSECIGELSAIDGKPSSALVLAVEDARVLKLDKEVFWRRLIKLQGVAENLMVTLTERMRRSNEKAMVLQREHLELKHLKKELELARQLQASMLPLQRPLFPGRADIEVCGFMEPASKIGGDLFDAFFVDSRTLFICIGDVSGHGIAASLFMVRVIGLLRMLAMDTMQPDSILETLNDRLCIGNDTNLFVTLFCGFLDVQSGSLTYSNGGHCAPIIHKGREVTLLPLPKGMLVGAASGRRYACLEYVLQPGETLLCYTDGVTEAESQSGKPFSEAGCVDLMRQHAARPLLDLLDALHDGVVSHIGSRLLADDCTMLAVRRPSF